MPSFAKDDPPDHPTPKPLDAFGIPMRQHVARGGLCYEPFSGSGSQIMAGEANGRRVFAMESSPAYCGGPVERWRGGRGARGGPAVGRRAGAELAAAIPRISCGWTSVLPNGAPWCGPAGLSDCNGPDRVPVDTGRVPRSRR